MPRAIPDDFLAAIQAGELLPAFFVQIQLVSETLCLWTRMGTINWNGQTWHGVGSMLGVSQIEEGSNVQARGIVITLSGLDPIELPEVLSDFKLGLPVTVLLWLVRGICAHHADRKPGLCLGRAHRSTDG